MGRKLSHQLTEFKAVYSSGVFIPDGDAVTAVSLLFSKVLLPNNIELIKEFSKKFRIVKPVLADEDRLSMKITAEDGSEADPFCDLTADQKLTVHRYLYWGTRFALAHAQLFGEVFETNLFEKGEPFKVTLVKKGAPGKLNEYIVAPRPMRLVSDDEKIFPDLVRQGYVPVVGRYHPGASLGKDLDPITAKQLAALLAMKSIQLLFPATSSARPDIILEARYRLSSHLPPFWSSMLKLSTELKRRIRECQSASEVVREGEDLIETMVRPSLIDLVEKMTKERKNWFYNILSPIQKGLRLIIGNPPLTQQQLITNALVLGADVTTSIAGQMKTIEALKQEAGLTFLLELHKVLNK